MRERVRSGMLGFITAGPIAACLVSGVEPRIIAVVFAMFPGRVFLMLQDVLRTADRRTRTAKRVSFFWGFAVCTVLSILAWWGRG